nr:unnamed protein product [Callosobruchus chinensis]
MSWLRTLKNSKGHLPNHERGGRRPANPEEDEVLEAVEEDPSTSLRAIEITTGVPKSTAHRILKRHELHPYHVQRVQTLLSADYQRRVNFSRTILERCRDDPFFLTKILWSDESTFKKDRYMNMHNYHEWHVENPHLTRQDRSQYRFKVNMWTGILNGQIIGPFELPDALNGEVYLDFLQNHLPSLLEDVPLNIRREMWLQRARSNPSKMYDFYPLTGGFDMPNQTMHKDLVREPSTTEEGEKVKKGEEKKEENREEKAEERVKEGKTEEEEDED